MAEQRIMGSSITPQTLAQQGMTQKNQIAKQQADIERQRMATQQSLQAMQNQARAEDRAAEMHRAKMGEMGANERQRMQQEGWDKQRMHDAAESQKGREARRQEVLLEQRVKAIQNGMGVKFGNGMKQDENAAWSYLRDTPIPIGTGGYDEIAQHLNDKMDWTREQGRIKGRKMQEYANARFAVSRSEKNIQDSMTDQLLNLQQQALSLDDTRKNFREQYKNIDMGIHSYQPRMMSILTAPDAEQIGTMGRLYQLWENSGAGNFVPLGGMAGGGNSIIIRPDGDYRDYPFYNEIYGKGGSASGMEIANEPVADQIIGLVNEARSNQSNEITEQLLDAGYDAEQIQGALGEQFQSQHSWEETTLGTEGVTREEFIQAQVAITKSKMDPENMSAEDRALVSQIGALSKSTSWNPFADPETIKMMKSGKMMDWTPKAFSKNPYWGGDVAATALDGSASLRRYAQATSNELKGNATFSQLPKVLMPVIDEIIRFKEGGQENPEELKKALFELTLGEGKDPRMFMMIDDLLDTWGSGAQGPAINGEAFFDQLEKNKFDMESDFGRSIVKAHKDMMSEASIVSGIWNSVTGASSMNATQNRNVIEGASDHLIEELQGLSERSMGFIPDTTDQQMVKEYSQHTLNRCWDRLMSPFFSEMPLEVKEAIYKKMGAKLEGINLREHQKLVGALEEKFGGITEFFNQMWEGEDEFSRGGREIQTRQLKERDRQLSDILGQFEGTGQHKIYKERFISNYGLEEDIQ